MDYAKESLKLHYNWKGKIEVTPRVAADSEEALSLAYTPGVAQPCLEIKKDVSKSYELTRRWNTVAVITDGSAVLGLGDIGPEAGMPVMEGKCVLFKAFGDVDAIPLCIRSNDVDEIVNTVALLAGSFGGVNLEDISAPRCFEIEKKLKERCDIPVFHDDQHGTAVITLAGLLNALKQMCIRDRFMHYSDKEGQEKDMPSLYVEKAESYIETNYSYPITVEDIAHYVGVSRSHLFRSFQTYMQRSPKEYLTEYRIKQACHLLKETELSVSAIAYSVGFENNLYFSKAFKKQKGVSPSEYRKSRMNRGKAASI